MTVFYKTTLQCIINACANKYTYNVSIHRFVTCLEAALLAVMASPSIYVSARSWAEFCK